MLRKFASGNAAVGLLLALSFCLPVAQAQNGELRGPITQPVKKNSGAAASGRVSASDSLGPESVPATPRATDGTILDTNQPFVNPPAAPPSADNQPIPKLETSTDQHTNISIPLDMNAATTGLLLDTTNPNRKPPKPPEPLTAVLSNVEMTISKQEIVLGDYHGLQVHVANGTDRPLLFNGAKAVLRLGDSVAKPVTTRQIDDEVNPYATTKDQVVAVLKAGVTVGALPTVKDIKMQRGPILQRYGSDEKRREDEQSRFGNRILWPGDSSDGIIYFQTDKSLHGGTLELPVCSLADFQDKTALKGQSNVTNSAPLGPIAEGETVAEPQDPSLRNTRPAVPWPSRKE
jgi:hypothetical protein